jgi:hypothetical protein
MHTKTPHTITLSPAQPELAPSRSTVRIEHTGAKLAVQFFGLPTEEDIFGCQERLRLLIERSGCRAVAFDLSNLPTVRSSLVALMVSARRGGVGVELLDPSPHVQECLRVMRLDQLLTVRGDGAGSRPK